MKYDSNVRMPSLRLSAVLLLTGQLLFIVVSLFHPGGHANDHPAIFATYAGSGIWTAVHLGQFVSMLILLAGLFSLFFAMDTRDRVARWAARLGSVMAAVALALYGVLQAVDGVALKQAVDAWAGTTGVDRTARFASAETVRWLEWGVRSYQNIVLGLALLMFAAAVVRTAWVPRPAGWLMGLSGMAYLVQGWQVGADGFPESGTLTIIVTYALSLAWMVWMTVAARRTTSAES